MSSTLRDEILGELFPRHPSTAFAPATEMQSARMLAGAARLLQADGGDAARRAALRATAEREAGEAALVRRLSQEAFPPDPAGTGLAQLHAAWQAFRGLMWGPGSPSDDARRALAEGAADPEAVGLELRRTTEWIEDRMLWRIRDGAEAMPFPAGTSRERADGIRRAMDSLLEAMERPHGVQAATASRQAFPRARSALPRLVQAETELALRAPEADLQRLPPLEREALLGIASGEGPGRIPGGRSGRLADAPREGDGPGGALAPCFLMTSGYPFDPENRQFDADMGDRTNANQATREWFAANAAVVPVLERDGLGPYRNTPSERLMKEMSDRDPEGALARTHAVAVDSRGSVAVVERADGSPFWNGGCLPGSPEERRLLEAPGALRIRAPEEASASPAPGAPVFVRVVPSLLRSIEGSPEEGPGRARLRAWEPSPAEGAEAAPSNERLPGLEIERGTMFHPHAAAVAAAARLGGPRPVAACTGRQSPAGPNLYSSRTMDDGREFAPHMSAPCHAALLGLTLSGHDCMIVRGDPPSPRSSLAEGAADPGVMAGPDDPMGQHLGLLWAWTHERDDGIPYEAIPGPALPGALREEPAEGPRLRVEALVPSRSPAEARRAVAAAAAAGRASGRPVALLCEDAGAAAAAAREAEVPLGDGPGEVAVLPRDGGPADAVLVGGLDPCEPADAPLWRALAAAGGRMDPIALLGQPLGWPPERPDGLSAVAYGGAEDFRRRFGAEPPRDRAAVPEGTARVLCGRTPSGSSAGTVVLGSTPRTLPRDPERAARALLALERPPEPQVFVPGPPPEGMRIDPEDLTKEPIEAPPPDRTALAEVLLRSGAAQAAGIGA